MKLNKKYLFFVLLLITFLLTTTIVSADDSLNDTKEEYYQLHNIEKENIKALKKSTQKNELIEKDNTKLNSTTKTADSTQEDTRIKTSINVKKIPKTYVGDNVTFNGGISSEKSLAGSTIFISDNVVILNTTVDNSNSYSLNYRLPRNGTYTFKIYYEGNDEFAPSSTKVTFDGVQRKTLLSYNRVKKEYVGKEIHISGRLSHQEELLENAKIEIHLNDEIHYVYTDMLGEYSYAFVPNEEKSYDVDIYYHGTNIYGANEKHDHFDIVKKTTNVTMAVRAINYYGNITNITGKLVAAGEVMPNTKINLTVNDKTISLKTDDKGIYHYKYKVLGVYNHTLTASYLGDYAHKACNITKKFKVYKLKTVLFIEPIKNIEYNNTASIRGVLITGNDTIANAKVKITVNNKTVTCTTDKNGKFVYNYKTNSIQTNTVKAEYLGNYTYYPTEENSTFNTVKRSSKVLIDHISSKLYNEQIQITGKISSYNSTINKAKIIINIDNKNITTTTGSDGKYVLNYRVKTLGKNSITVSFAGNKIYKKSENSRIFTVNQNQLKIKLNPIASVYYSLNTSITGKVIDVNSKTVGNINLNIKVDKKNYTVKSDSKGLFNLSVKTMKSGKNNLSISYNGNKYYRNYTLKTTFTVSNMPTKLTLNKITPKNVGENVIIRGTLKDVNNKSLKNQPVTLQINNNEIILKTNNKGVYKYTIKAELLGKNNVSVSFIKNYYSKNSQYRTFDVSKKAFKIKLNPIQAVRYSLNTSISGKVVDVNNKSIKNFNFTIKVDTKEYVVKSDNKGLFNISVKTMRAGKNDLYINYPGNSYYRNYTLKTTFTASKMPTKLTLNKITTKSLGEEVVIAGTLKDENNKLLKNQQITLELNGEKIFLKTDNKGVYKHTFNADVLGKNTVTVTFSQNNYSKNSQYRSFVVQ